MSAEEQVTISRQEYERLQREALLLECLRSNGVEDWEGFNEAVEQFNSFWDSGSQVAGKKETAL